MSCLFWISCPSLVQWPIIMGLVHIMSSHQGLSCPSPASCQYNLPLSYSITHNYVSCPLLMSPYPVFYVSSASCQFNQLIMSQSCPIAHYSVSCPSHVLLFRVHHVPVLTVSSKSTQPVLNYPLLYILWTYYVFYSRFISPCQLLI